MAYCGLSALAGGMALGFVWGGARRWGGGALVSVSGFRGFSASVGKAFILAGGGALGYHSVEFRH